MLRRWAGLSGEGVATHADAAADAFAAALTVLRLLTTGAPLFESAAAAREALLPAGGCVPPARLAALSEPKRSIVGRMLAPAPADRPSARVACDEIHASRGRSVLGALGTRLEAAVAATHADVRAGVAMQLAAAVATAAGPGGTPAPE